jgi:hypothetical protein
MVLGVRNLFRQFRGRKTGRHAEVLIVRGLGMWRAQLLQLKLASWSLPRTAVARNSTRQDSCENGVLISHVHLFIFTMLPR